MKKSQEMKGKINPRYDLNALDIQDIVENTVDTYGAICAAFNFGYLKGSRATKKEMLKDVDDEKKLQLVFYFMHGVFIGNR